jgi:hypothetical protein
MVTGSAAELEGGARGWTQAVAVWRGSGHRKPEAEGGNGEAAVHFHGVASTGERSGHAGGGGMES